MTYSIVARDPATGHLGIAVASLFFAAGAIVPYVRGRVGAVATQAFINPTYGTDGLAMLAEGEVPDTIISTLTARDDGSALRQMHLIDANGRSAAFTGESCTEWAGHLITENISVAGNMLAGPAVIEETLSCYQASMALPFAERLLLAMQAGENAGGDKRGRQSAALLIHRDQDYAWLDLRCDDHSDPLEELRRLYRVAQERYLFVADILPTHENPHGMTDRRDIDAKIADLEAKREREGRPSPSRMSRHPAG